MKNNYQILIPIKHFSSRCPGKNRLLLPYTVKYLTRINRLDLATVITDSEELLAIAETLGLKTFFEKREEGQDELKSCLNYVSGKLIDFFFIMPVTQPLRSSNLIDDAIRYIESNPECDFITSYITCTDRAQFEISNINGMFKFAKQFQNRIGRNCREILMLDGAIYLINSTFLQKVSLNNDMNSAFWNGNFGCVENKVPFLDIDTPKDLEKWYGCLEFMQNL